MTSGEAFKLRQTAILIMQAAHKHGQKETPELLERRKQSKIRYAKADAEYSKIRNAEMRGS